jgi:hypothetical protein
MSILELKIKVNHHHSIATTIIARHILSFFSPNVYRTPTESLQAFQWFNEVGEWEKHFSAWERFVVVYIGSAVMWIIGKRLKKKHGLKPGKILTSALPIFCENVIFNPGCGVPDIHVVNAY